MRRGFTCRFVACNVGLLLLLLILVITSIISCDRMIARLPTTASAVKPSTTVANDWLRALGERVRPIAEAMGLVEPTIFIPDLAVPYNRSAPIPLHLYFTARRSTAPIEARVRAIQSMHPGFNATFFDDDAARQFLSRSPLGLPFAEAFDRIRVGAHRADYFRYCILYVRGGWYLDLDNVPLVPLTRHLISGDAASTAASASAASASAAASASTSAASDVDFLSVLHVGAHKSYDRDRRFDRKSIHNGLIAARAGSPLLLHLLRHMMKYPTPRRTLWAPLPYHYYTRYAYVHLATHLGEPELFPGIVYTYHAADEDEGRRRQRPRPRGPRKSLTSPVESATAIATATVESPVYAGSISRSETDERILLLDSADKTAVIYGRPP